MKLLLKSLCVFGFSSILWKKWQYSFGKISQTITLISFIVLIHAILVMLIIVLEVWFVTHYDTISNVHWREDLCSEDVSKQEKILEMEKKEDFSRIFSSIFFFAPSAKFLLRSIIQKNVAPWCNLSFYHSSCLITSSYMITFFLNPRPLTC